MNVEEIVSYLKRELVGKTKPLFVILGPTGSGKTAISVQLAKLFDGEIVSADSRQVYRGMDLGTAKIRVEEMQGIPHHLIDIVDPNVPFSVAEYKEKAVQAIQDIIRRKRVPFLVGGTMLYIDAVTKNLEIPRTKPDETLRQELETQSVEELFRKLQELDPEMAEEIDAKNKRRLVRALEYCLDTGEKFSEARKVGPQLFESIFIGLDIPREELYQRLDARSDEQIRSGLIEETKKLAEQYSWDIPSMSGIGYRQIGMYLRGEISLEEAQRLQKRDNRRYASRQLTWWRRDPRIRWF